MIRGSISKLLLPLALVLLLLLLVLTVVYGHNKSVGTQSYFGGTKPATYSNSLRAARSTSPLSPLGPSFHSQWRRPLPDGRNPVPSTINSFALLAPAREAARVAPGPSLERLSVPVFHRRPQPASQPLPQTVGQA